MTKDRKCRSCPALIYRDSKTGLCVACYKSRTAHIATEPSTQLAADRDKQKLTSQLTGLRAQYKEALGTIERQEHELAVVSALEANLDTFTIEPKHGQGTSEGVAVLVASDFHVEESVGAEVGGLNVFNLDIAKQRVERFFQAGLRLVKLLQQDIKIETVVLALLGDFISNDIHEEIAELAEQSPMHALVTAQNFLISGIEFLLANSTLNFVIPCHSGNHARTTKTTRFSTENGHSLEYLMYLHLKAYFKNELRITFIIPEGYHSYLDVLGVTIRFHHGHAIKYGGGIGGIFIPAFKSISQWNKARHADLDVIGHFHSMKDGGNFLCNGSLIGYNGFALAMKCDYEKPKQLLFLIDKKRGRTATWPILLED